MCKFYKIGADYFNVSAASDWKYYTVCDKRGLPTFNSNESFNLSTSLAMSSSTQEFTFSVSSLS